MDIFEEMQKYGHEELNLFYEPEFDLKAIVSIHNSNLGIAFGATRLANYFYEGAAILDALKLARNSTMSASILNCDLGGASSILINDDTGEEKGEGYLRAYGRFMRSLGNRLCTMPDSSFTQKDIMFISKEFPNVIGQPEFYGSEGPSYFIAYGALCGIKACANEAFASSVLDKKRILVQGLTPAAIQLVKMLSNEGAEIIVTDQYYDNVKKLKDEISSIQVVRYDEYEEITVDIFVPCSGTGMVTKKYIDEKRCKIVAGMSKLQLASDDISELMHKNGIIYAPEIVMNAAEAVVAFCEIFGYDDKHIKNHIEQISEVMSEILVKSRETGETPCKIAQKNAIDRLSVVHKLKKIFIGNFAVS